MKRSAPVAERPSKSPKRPRKKVSPSEILARCLEVQADWSPAEKQSRQVSSAKNKKRYRIDRGSDSTGIDPIMQAHINFAKMLLASMN